MSILDVVKVRPETPFARIRRARGFTVKQLSQETGMSMDMIFRYQRGELMPKRSVRRVLAHVLQATEHELFPDLEEPPQPRTDQRPDLSEPASTVAG